MSTQHNVTINTAYSEAINGNYMYTTWGDRTNTPNLVVEGNCFKTYNVLQQIAKHIYGGDFLLNNKHKSYCAHLKENRLSSNINMVDQTYELIPLNRKEIKNLLPGTTIAAYYVNVQSTRSTDPAFVPPEKCLIKFPRFNKPEGNITAKAKGVSDLYHFFKYDGFNADELIKFIDNTGTRLQPDFSRDKPYRSYGKGAIKFELSNSNSLSMSCTVHPEDWVVISKHGSISVFQNIADFSEYFEIV